MSQPTTMDSETRRQLRREWRQFEASLVADAHRMQMRPATFNPTQTVPSARLGEIIHILVNVNTLGCRNMDAKKAALQALRDWIFSANKRSIHQADLLYQLQILPDIGKFVENTPERHQKQRARGIPDWAVEELTILHRKWSKGDLSCDPNRGLTAHPVTDNYGNVRYTRYELDKNYQHYVSGSVYGENGLVNGQRWYSRTQLMRDGAHNTKMGGIAGNASDGAYSIVVGARDGSHEYNDVDRGDELWYEGTALTRAAGSTTSSSNNNNTVTPTNSTQRLLTSRQNGRPIRVIRTFNLPRDGARENKLYRYDGLYTVTAATCNNPITQEWRFKLNRVPGQGALRPVRHT